VGLGLCATIWNARPAARQAPPAPLPRGEEKDTPAARSG